MISALVKESQGTRKYNNIWLELIYYYSKVDCVHFRSIISEHMAVLATVLICGFSRNGMIEVIRQVDDVISYNSQHTQNEQSNNHKK